MCEVGSTCDDGDGCTVDSCSTEDCGPVMCDNECACATFGCQPFYVLPNDVDEFEIVPFEDNPSTLYLAMSNPSIAKFVTLQGLASTTEVNGPPFRVEIQGLRAGTAMLQVRIDSANGELISSIPVNVGGSITFQFDQLPTYTPWGSTVVTGAVAGTDPFISEDYQLDGLTHSAIGPLFQPTSTLEALDAFPNAVMSSRVVVRNSAGEPVVNKLVIVLQVPDDANPAANQMLITPTTSMYTDGAGRVENEIRVQNPDGFLEADIPNWKVLVLVGRAAEMFNANPASFELQGAMLRNEVSLDDRLSNGHLLMVKHEQFGVLEPQVETAMAIRLPHVSVRAHAILVDWFENHSGRVSAPITDSTTFNQAYWQIQDFRTLSPLDVTSTLWNLPEVRSIILPEYDRPLEFSLPSYPEDDLSALIQALQIASYDPDAITLDGDPIQPGSAALIAGTIVAEVVLGLVPIVGGGRDSISDVRNYARGSDDAS